MVPPRITRVADFAAEIVIPTVATNEATYLSSPTTDLATRS